ncbi:hypothetical protein BB558_000875 [Smittium angustum]|uniref:CCHC-type domain-containing protein n=1 Tax=Smittium angustum TaxID=133377 RepID=A0A2U1JD70_SMIAN|nr:hypothetical protein BB558_000875 [Smittium angustum]
MYSHYQNAEEYENLIYTDSETNSDLDSEEEQKILSHLYYQNDSNLIKKINTPPQTTVPFAPPSPQSDTYQKTASSFIQSHSSFTNKKDDSNIKLHIKKQFSQQQTLNFLDQDTNEDSKYLIKSKSSVPQESSLLNLFHKNKTDSNISNQKEQISQVIIPDSSPKTPEKRRHIASQILELPKDSDISPENEQQKDYNSDESYTYLDEAEYGNKNRYYIPENKKQKTCRLCQQVGHLSKDCKMKVCNICGNTGHISFDCKAQTKVCHNCNQRGHISANCPNPLTRNGPVNCSRCHSRYHHSEECSTIWRRYVYTKYPSEIGNISRTFCYNCASNMHFGDDCNHRYSRWSTYEDKTAFRIDNCPEGCRKIAQNNKSGTHLYYNSDSDVEFGLISSKEKKIKTQTSSKSIQITNTSSKPTNAVNGNIHKEQVQNDVRKYIDKIYNNNNPNFQNRNNYNNRSFNQHHNHGNSRQSNFRGNRQFENDGFARGGYSNHTQQRGRFPSVNDRIGNIPARNGGGRQGFNNHSNTRRINRN